MTTNLEAARGCALAAWHVGKPLTVYFQDRYSPEFEEGSKSLTDVGVAGIKVEDYSRQLDRFYPMAEATDRAPRQPKASQTLS